MGIPKAIAKALIQEHKYREFEGNMVMLGRQSTYLRIDEARELIKGQDVPLKKGFVGYDDSTKASKNWSDSITEKSFFSQFCNANILTIDVTKYEACDIVHDMNRDIPQELEGVADIVWLGSCLDNIANPIKTLENAIRIVKPGGRIIDFEMITMSLSAYIAYSPNYFVDFLAYNGFENARIYVCISKEHTFTTGNWDIFSIDDNKFSHRKSLVLPNGYVGVTYWVADAPKERRDFCTHVQGKYRPINKSVEVASVIDEWLGKGERPLLSCSRAPNKPTLGRCTYLGYL